MKRVKVARKALASRSLSQEGKSSSKTEREGCSLTGDESEKTNEIDFCAKGVVTWEQGDVHVHTSLPPSLEGQLRALLRVEVSQLVWFRKTSAPSGLLVTLRWWGESTSCATFR